MPGTGHTDPPVSNASVGEPADWEGTTKPERKAVVLQFLADSGLALPPTAIHRNLRLQAGFPSTYATTRRYLNELADDGLVRRVEREPLDDRELRSVTDDSRAWYIATEDGKRPYGMAALDAE